MKKTNQLDLIRAFVEIKQGVDLENKSRLREFVAARYYYYRMCFALTFYQDIHIASKIGFDRATAIYFRDKFNPSQKQKERLAELLHDYKLSNFEIDLDHVRKERKVDRLLEKIKSFVSQIEVLQKDREELLKENEKLNNLLNELGKTSEVERIYHSLSDKRKEDLLFKARTIYKIQQKLEAA